MNINSFNNGIQSVKLLMNQKIMRKIFLIFFILCPSLSFGIEKADSVLVIKSELKLYLILN